VAESNGKTSIQVIERMMDLVDALARSNEPVNLKRLSLTTGLHPSTAHRILNMLVGFRMVERVVPGTYRLGLRLLELGNLVKSRISLRDLALPSMQRLHEELSETIDLVVRQGDETICVERLASDPTSVRMLNIASARMPLHGTAVGKIFLLEDGPDKCRDYAQRTGLPILTKNTLHDLAALTRDLERIRKLSYAQENEEAEKGVSCLGAGIYDDESRLVAGLSVSAPSHRLDKSWGPRIREIAEEISRSLGFRADIKAA
jgi:DNA-binding IclR family transcriptional regulator